VRPGTTRSRGPPASGAITGKPEASASCTVWQNVSKGPVCTKTSRLAYACASSSPVLNPRKAAPGNRLTSWRRSGPSPTTTSATPGVARNADSRSTFFSGANRPTKPTSSSPWEASCERSCSSRREGRKCAVSTPRAQRCTRGMPWAASAAAAELDGASVRSAPLCNRRVQRHAARAAKPSP
jgi:hypothetical protein